MSRAALLAALDPDWVRDPLYRAAGKLPAVDWRFAQDRSLVDRIRGLPLTFTRTTGRTWVQADGSNGTLNANAAAFIYSGGVSLGLDVQESRTNLFLNTATPATQNITVTAAAHTLSFKGTGTITLSGASTAGPLVGTGANNRVPLVFTPSAGSLTLTLSGSITEPQLELGGSASPFIPTAGASVQRTADVCGTTDLSWYNPAGGLFYVELALPTLLSGFPQIYEVDDGTTSNRFGSYVFTNGYYGFAVRSGSVQSPDQSVITTPVAGKFAHQITAGNAFSAFNGSLSAINTTLLMPATSMTSLSVGRRGVTASNHLNGTIARLTYFSPGPAANRLQRLTA